MNKEDENMETVLDPKYNPLTEAKKLLRKSMEQKKRTPKDVKESLNYRKIK